MRGLCLPALVIFILGLAACSNDPEPTGVVNAELIDTIGKTHTLAEYRGQWVILNYWATWCPPCVEEMPMLSEFHSANSNVVILGVAQEPVDANTLKAFTSKLGVEYPIFPGFPDQLERLNETFPLRGLPTTYFINPEGKIVDKVEGPLKKSQLEQIISS